jgi:hypothetical protein
MSAEPINVLSEAHQDLLCFLVATVAASYALTRDWRVDHVVESCRLWLRRNGVVLSWLQRVRLGQLAFRIARRDLRRAGIAVRQAHVQSLFTADMALNMSSTLVQRMRDVCGNACASIALHDCRGGDSMSVLENTSSGASSSP